MKMSKKKIILYIIITIVGVFIIFTNYLIATEKILFSWDSDFMCKPVCFAPYNCLQKGIAFNFDNYKKEIIVINDSCKK
ncbi:MAG: hypothetical protein V1898_04185 [Patescibacteria group bacterium]